MFASEVLEIEREGFVAILWLNRPASSNALGAAFWEDLPLAMTSLASDDEVRAVVLAARGKHFSVGLDLTEIAGILGPRSSDGDGAGRSSTASRSRALRAAILRMQAAVSAVADCPVPVVAAVHGHCVGGGVDLVTACDLRVASADAVFSVRETRMAMVADLGTLQRLPAIVGAGHVAELAFTGGDVTAARAAEIGLVNRVYDDREAVLAGARALAAEIAALSPLAVQGTKAVLRANDGGTTERGLEYAATWNAAMLESEDLSEAVAAFFEKRPPRFTGR